MWSSLDVHGEDADSVCEMTHVCSCCNHRVDATQTRMIVSNTAGRASNFRDRHRQRTVSIRDLDCGECHASVRLKRLKGRQNPSMTELSTDRTRKFRNFFCPVRKIGQQN